MGSSGSTEAGNDSHCSTSWDGDKPETYPASTCHEGYGGSHCSPGDVMQGAHAMNNIDDAFEVPGAGAACLMGGDAPYHAAPENITGGCPDPTAHGPNDDVSAKK